MSDIEQRLEVHEVAVLTCIQILMVLESEISSLTQSVKTNTLTFVTSNTNRDVFTVVSCRRLSQDSDSLRLCILCEFSLFPATS